MWVNGSGWRALLSLHDPDVSRRRGHPAGLPITSALLESLVKEINRRVKGTEKFWNDPRGATSILALKAASLCATTDDWKNYSPDDIFMSCTRWLDTASNEKQGI